MPKATAILSAVGAVAILSGCSSDPSTRSGTQSVIADPNSAPLIAPDHMAAADVFGEPQPGERQYILLPMPDGMAAAPAQPITPDLDIDARTALPEMPSSELPPPQPTDPTLPHPTPDTHAEAPEIVDSPDLQ